jgi:hypothetical protein
MPSMSANKNLGALMRRGSIPIVPSRGRVTGAHRQTLKKQETTSNKTCQ